MREAKPKERDMTRAHWQMGAGAVVMNQLARQYYQESLRAFGEDNIKILLNLTDYFGRQYGLYGTWAQAHALASGFMKTIDFNPKTTTDIEAQMVRHTYAKSANGATEEGMMTEARFPLNLAYLISAEAREKSVDGFEVKSLLDIADFFRRPDFRRMVDQSAFTLNNIWGGFAAMPSTEIHIPLISSDISPPEVSFEFSDGQVAFSEEFGNFLHSELVRVNQQGLSEGTEIQHRTSTGCPVRHLQPHFSSDPEAQDELARLAVHFGKTPEELTAKQDKTVIEEGLDHLADVFEQADQILAQQGKLTMNISRRA
jgi:hypothetical protein